MTTIERIVDDYEFLIKVSESSSWGSVFFKKNSSHFFSEARLALEEMREYPEMEKTTYFVNNKKRQILPIFEIKRQGDYLLATLKRYINWVEVHSYKFKLKA
jgi:hypothetical protein